MEKLFEKLTFHTIAHSVSTYFDMRNNYKHKLSTFALTIYMSIFLSNYPHIKEHTIFRIGSPLKSSFL